MHEVYGTHITAMLMRPAFTSSRSIGRCRPFSRRRRPCQIASPGRFIFASCDAALERAAAREGLVR